MPPWMYLESGKWWFGLIGILIGVSTILGSYIYRRGQIKPSEKTDQE